MQRASAPIYTLLFVNVNIYGMFGISSKPGLSLDSCLLFLDLAFQVVCLYGASRNISLLPTLENSIWFSSIS